jgi:hypothetical protein
VNAACLITPKGSLVLALKMRFAEQKFTAITEARNLLDIHLNGKAK